jgi:hypothetical protein
MSRPIKNTVDYFPHIIHNGKTRFILESKFGNDGYAFWFKLLELLGSSHNHVYDYNNPSDWEFMLAKTKVGEQKAKNILQTLANVGAIDAKLLEKKIIWSENFVKNIADAYKRRKQDLPKKPVIDNKNHINESKNPVDDDIKPQIKLNKSKLNNNKEKESIKKKKKYNRKEHLKKYAEYVKLTEKEYERFVKEYGKDKTKKFIEKLNNYKGSHNKKYHDDNLTIRNWVIDEVLGKKEKSKWDAVKEMIKKEKEAQDG